MNNRPTPETDAETIYCDAMPNMPWVDADICRKLERERDEAREALRKAIRFVDAYEPHSPITEADQNETLSIIRKVLEGVK
jgi:hypothetical protein